MSKNNDDDFNSKILKKFNGIGLQLHSYTMLEKAPDTKIWGLIRYLYMQTDSSQKIGGIVLNYAVTSGQSVFTLSMSILEALVRNDKNQSLQKPGDGTIQKFFVKAKNSILRELFPFQKAGKFGKRPRAGLYLIEDEDIRELLSDEIKAKEEDIIELYAKTNGIESEDQKRARERDSIVDEEVFGDYRTYGAYMEARAELISRLQETEGKTLDEAEDQADLKFPVLEAITKYDNN